MPGGRPAKYPTAAALAAACQAYRVHVESTEGEVPSTAGLRLHLGLAGQSALGDQSNRGPEFSSIIKGMKDWIEHWWARRLAGSSGSAAAGSIFALKNLAGWTDKQEINQTVSVSGDLESRLSTALLDRHGKSSITETDDPLTH